MGVLSGIRTSDATKIGHTDDWDVELETDIAEIFGIEVGRVITEPIFRSSSIDTAAVVDSGNQGQVNADGSITGVVRLAANVSSAAGAAGIEFQSSTDVRYKICAIAENLELYQWNDDPLILAWELVTSINLLANFGTFLGLTDVYDKDDGAYTGYVDMHGYIPMVIEDLTIPANSHLELVPPSEAGFYPEWVDLVDVPLLADAGSVLMAMNAGGVLDLKWEPVTGAGGVTKLSQLSDVDGFSDPMVELGATLIVCNPGGGAPADPRGRAVYPIGGRSTLRNPPGQSSFVIDGEGRSLLWERHSTNQTTWGNDAEGGEMTSFMFADGGEGDPDARYRKVQIPARFPGFYEVILSLHYGASSGQPLEIVATNQGNEPPLYIFDNRRTIEMPKSFYYTDPDGHLRVNCPPGFLTVTFNLLATYAASPPSNLAFTILHIGSTPGTSRLYTDSSITVFRRG